MNPDPIFEILADSEYGAYAVSVDGTILFWNGGAQRLLGYTSDDVVGRRCSDVLAGLCVGLLAQGLTPVQAAVCALHLGGAAADAYIAQRPPHTMVATDLLDMLPQALQERFS